MHKHLTHVSPMSVEVRLLCNLRIADDVDLLGVSEAVLQPLTGRPAKTAAGSGMGTRSDNAKSSAAA